MSESEDGGCVLITQPGDIFLMWLCSSVVVFILSIRALDNFQEDLKFDGLIYLGFAMHALAASVHFLIYYISLEKNYLDSESAISAWNWYGHHLFFFSMASILGVSLSCATILWPHFRWVGVFSVCCIMAMCITTAILLR